MVKKASPRIALIRLVLSEEGSFVNVIHPEMDLREEVPNLFEMQAFIRSLRGHPVEAGCWYSDHETSLFSAYEDAPTICA